MNTTTSDSFWATHDDDGGAMGDGLSALRGYSPAPTMGNLMRTSSADDSLRPAIQTSTYGLSPSALDPNSFSSQFILPRFASAGSGDAFGYPGVGMAQSGG